MWEKRQSEISQGVAWEKREQGIYLTGYSGEDEELILPDEIEGEPVTGIGAYAFARTKITMVWLPLYLREVERYAFYRCKELGKLILSDSLPEIGGGALSGCQVRQVEMELMEGEKSCLKSILDEIRFGIKARLFYHLDGKEQEVRILFPEHYEEAVENTPARILVTHHHGAGGYYRQCFYDRKLDYKKYDEIFFRAEAEEAPAVTAELSLNRLRFPFGLSESARASYEGYMKEHLTDAADVLFEADDSEGIRFLLRQPYWTGEAMEHALEKAAARGETELFSFLMEEKRRLFQREKKQRFEL